MTWHLFEMDSNMLFLTHPSLHPLRKRRGSLASWLSLGSAVVLSLALTACGGGGDGPAVRAAPQSLSVDAAPAMLLGSTRTVHAQASSGLAVKYTSSTPTVCTVSSTGVVTALSTGNCVITVSQDGNPDFAPAAPAILRFAIEVNPHQIVAFQAAPELSLGGTTTVTARASSGLPVQYSSQTLTVCTVDAASGVVTSLTQGDCVIAADQNGDSTYQVAPQVRLTLPVSVPAGVTVPFAPTGVQVSVADTPGAVVVSAVSTSSGGSPILRYNIRSSSAGVTSQVASLPATVNCGGSCNGLAFTVSATNALGEGPASSLTHIITRYALVQTFFEPDTQPRNTIFTGTFTFDATTAEVLALQGTLTESMTGDPTASSPDHGMTALTLGHQLSAVRDEALGGLLVTTFLLPSTDTFTKRFGGDGWTPGSGFGLYAGFPSGQNPSSGGIGNAYARIFVNLSDPSSPLSQPQIDKLAYADCTAGGMMGATCMTGTTVAGYGSVGTMSGYPISLVIRKVN